jgi:hypothetical protein
MPKVNAIKIILILLIFTLFLPVAKADVGIGIRWGIEELFLNEFEEKCVSYGIYNPFDTEVTAQIFVEREIEAIVKSIEPTQVYLPAYTGAPNDNAAKLANKKDVKICFYANPFRWPPFYPKDYKGVVIASVVPGKIGTTGSAAISAVQAPLTVRVGNMRMFYTFIGILCFIIAAIIFSVLLVKKKLPKKKKKYCLNCKREYSYSTIFCPTCGSKLEEKNQNLNSNI